MTANANAKKRSPRTDVPREEVATPRVFGIVPVEVAIV